MMSVRTAIPLGLLLGLLLVFLCASQVIEMCIKTFYLSDGVCKPCPNHCDICTNATQCTLCQMGYYGQLCEKECEVGCTGTCHKIYGQCTYGCEDGMYPDYNSLACLNCPKECKVCRSLTACAECHTGYYGESCRNMCPGLCKGSLCNTTDGTCFECKEGSYKVDRDCIVCPDGCARCNNSHTCTICNDGFIGPIHGRCFLECPTIKDKENVNVCNICLNENGSLCNMTICQNLPSYWKLQINECHHAMSIPSDCYTEGICVTSNDSLHALSMELTTYGDLEYSLNYMTFKCSLECHGHTTGYLMEPCEEQVCQVTCDLAEAANTVDMTTKSWVSSTCSLGTSRDNNERVLATDDIAFRVAIAVSVVCILIVALVVSCKMYKTNTRKKYSRQKGESMSHSNMTTLMERIPVFVDVSSVAVIHEKQKTRETSFMVEGHAHSIISSSNIEKVSNPKITKIEQPEVFERLPETKHDAKTPMICTEPQRTTSGSERRTLIPLTK